MERRPRPRGHRHRRRSPTAAGPAGSARRVDPDARRSISPACVQILAGSRGGVPRAARPSARPGSGGRLPHPVSTITAATRQAARRRDPRGAPTRVGRLPRSVWRNASRSVPASGHRCARSDSRQASTTRGMPRGSPGTSSPSGCGRPAISAAMTMAGDSPSKAGRPARHSYSRQPSDHTSLAGESSASSPRACSGLM